MAEIAIIIDIDSVSFKTVEYAIQKAQKKVSRPILVSDWERYSGGVWDRILKRRDLTFIQTPPRTLGKNSLDQALFSVIKDLVDNEIREFFILTYDKDFVPFVNFLHQKQCIVTGISGISTNRKLIEAYDQFFYYPLNIYDKIRKDNMIPNISPDNEVKEKLIAAYAAVESPSHWISTAQLGTSFKRLFPEFKFPAGHGKKFNQIIKVYYEYFEWKREGSRLLIRLK